MPHPSTSFLAEHSDIYVVVSPPRTASTAFARVLWNNPSIRYYAHEPFEYDYFKVPEVPRAWESAREAIDLSDFTGAKSGNSLLIKEITFQVGRSIGDLLAVTTRVPVFLIRDPRLTISSRRDVKRRSGRPLEFPLEETGWQAIELQIAFCRENRIDYVLVDAHDFRAHPESVMRQVYARLGLNFDADQLSWEPCPRVTLSNHRTTGVDHFFTRVLSSKGVEPPTEALPAIDDFPADGGLREHVEWAAALYRRLRQDPRRIIPVG